MLEKGIPVTSFKIQMFKNSNFKIHKGNIDMIGYLGAESGCGLHTFLALLNDLNIDSHYCLEFFLDP